MRLDEIDLLEDAWAQGVPHEAFDLLRRESPVHWHPEPEGPGFWAVTRHADVVRASRDTATFSSELGSTFIDDQTDEALAQIRLTILNMDPPKHARYRRLVSRGFTPRMVGRLVETIEKRAQRIVDEVADRGECEFVEDVAAKLPLEMICEMIGLPEADWHRMFELSNMLVGRDDPDFQYEDDVAESAAAEIYAYCDAVAADRRANPRDDLMTALVQAEVDGERLSDAELKMFFFLLVVAGNDTVRSALPGGVLTLLAHPDEYRRLRAEPALLDSAVEEMLRVHPPVLTFRRTAARDVELAGARIAAGDKVVVYHVSANHDERRFADPFRFDPAREPNEHLSFGQGPHLCLGAAFARLQLRAFFAEYRRLPPAEQAGEPVRLTSNVINGITHLPLQWERQR